MGVNICQTTISGNWKLFEYFAEITYDVFNCLKYALN